MSENNVAWKCKSCGAVTYHPSAKEKDPSVQIRRTTLCWKCLRDK